MNRVFTLILLLFASLPSRAQQPAFQEYEVQQPAEPQGGLPVLNQFLTVNLRKPFLAQVANVKGIVIVRGIVEPDGRIAEVSVLRSLRPDCDREAVRAFSLFNAWKPAQKDGKAVRQVVTIPVTFRPTEPVHYANGVAVRYYNNAFRVIASPDSAALRSETPTDTLGLPTGDVVFYKRNGTKWNKEAAMVFNKTERKPTKDGERSWTLQHLDANEKPFGLTYVVNADGLVLQETLYDLDRKPRSLLQRDGRGLVRLSESIDEEQSMQHRWYANGQRKHILVIPILGLPAKEEKPEQMLAYWDSTGRQVVSEGNGQVVRTEVKPPMEEENGAAEVRLTEQGTYERGLKQGLWTGMNQTKTYQYEEVYDKGLLVSGKAWDTGKADTVRYTKLLQQPEFRGGMPALGQFLSSHLQYPFSAQKENRSGRVFVSFVVCQDGTLCDHEVLKSVHPDLDAEALRVVKQMDRNWKPGVIRGKPVRVKYNVPINFQLN